MDNDFKFCYAYPRASITTDCVIFSFFDLNLHVLLIERAADPFKGYWAFPGGFLEMDETTLACAQRELHEETGLQDVVLTQLYTFSDVNRDPRGRTISVVYYGIADVRHRYPEAGDDAKRAVWYSVSELPPLAFDHRQVFERAFNELKFQMRLKPVFYPWLPQRFTMDDVLLFYNSVFDIQPVKASFEKQLLGCGLFSPLEDQHHYCFDKNNYLAAADRNFWFII